MGYEWTYTCACKRAPGVCGGVVVGFDLAETGMEDPGAEVRVEEKRTWEERCAAFDRFLDALEAAEKEVARVQAGPNPFAPAKDA